MVAYHFIHSVWTLYLFGGGINDPLAQSPDAVPTPPSEPPST